MKAALARVIARLKGWRTFLAFGSVVLLAVLQQLGSIDLPALLTFFGVPEPSKPGVIAFLGLVGIVLRVYTTTPPMQAAPPVPAVAPVPPVEGSR